MIDTGKTLNKMTENLKLKGANMDSIKIAYLFEKKAKKQIKIPYDTYYGIEIEDKFIIGFGVDFKDERKIEWFRTLDNLYEVVKERQDEFEAYMNSEEVLKFLK
jgi:hypoxanthine phosphoribosyltransferase